MKQQVLVIRRTMAASREQVFDCLTAADKMSKWFYGMEVGQAKASVDLRRNLWQKYVWKIIK